MRTFLARIALASASGLALAAALAGQAQAQTVTLPLPQPRPHVDGQGVDLTSGQVTASEADLSIGAKGTIGLTHRRVWAAGAGWRHSYLMIVSADSSTHVTVVLGGASYGYTLASGTISSGTFTADQGDGSSLTSNGSTYTWTGRDGTVVSFSQSLVANNASYYGAAAAVATTITAPTGVTTTLTYQQGSYQAYVFTTSLTFYVLRLSSVNTSTGYQLKYSYTSNTLSSATANSWMQVSQVMAINGAVDYCSPSAVTCTGFSYSWPTVGYAYSTSSTGAVTEQVTDPQGRVRQNFIDAAGRLTGIQRPTASSPSLSYIYASNGTVQSATVAGAGSWTYAFTTANNQLTAAVTNPWVNAPRTVVSATATHQFVSDTDENGWTTSYQQDAYGRITKATAPVGNSATYAYDARGNLTSTTVTAVGGGSSFTASSATFPTSCTVAATCNKPITSTDGNGNVTNYFYNTDGTVDHIQRPAVNGVRPEVHFVYGYVDAWVKTASGGFTTTPNAMSQLEMATTCRTQAWPCASSDQVVKTYLWQGGNAQGTQGTNLQLIGVTTAAGDNSVSATTSYGYDNVGDTLTVTDPAGNVTTTAYNSDRQPTTVTSPLPDGVSGRKVRQVQVQYQGDGLVSQTTLGTVSTGGSGWTAAQWLTTAYDGADRKASDELFDATGAAKAMTQYSYDSESMPLCVAVRMNPSVYGSLPSACTLSTQGSNGPDRITYYVHEYAGLEDHETNGYATNWQQHTVHYTHTLNGQVQTLTDANGNVTAYVYDGFSRLSRICYNSSASACPTASSNYETFGYDDAGNVTSHMTRAGQTFGFSYDALNRIATKTPPSGPATNFGYDLQGRMLSAAFADGSGTVSLAYDGLGRTTSTTVNMGGANRTVSYQYDVLGDVTRITHPDGVYFTIAYDYIGRMQQAWWNTGGGPNSFAGYQYDDLSRRTWAGVASSSTNYTYDSLSRLSNIQQAFAGGTGNLNEGLGYDAASGITTRTRDNTGFSFTGYANINRAYTANALNQYVTAGAASFSYDGNGNLTGDGTNTYGYDAENRLINASTSGGTTLTYDPLGRLFSTSSATYGTTQFLYDGVHVIAEYNGSGTLLRRFFWGPGADEPLLQDEGGQLNCTGTHFLQQDELGTVVAVADCWGNLKTANTYDEYGIPGSGNWGRFQYTGQAWIPDLGMYFYKARLYSPTLGRFMQTDPIGYGDGPNWYAYVHDDPVNGTDPSGKDVDLSGVFVFGVPGGGGGGVGGGGYSEIPGGSGGSGPSFSPNNNAPSNDTEKPPQVTKPKQNPPTPKPPKSGDTPSPPSPTTLLSDALGCGAGGLGIVAGGLTSESGLGFVLFLGSLAGAELGCTGLFNDFRPSR